MEFAKSRCAEIVDLMNTHCGGNRRLVIDKTYPVGRGSQAKGRTAPVVFPGS